MKNYKNKIKLLILLIATIITNTQAMFDAITKGNLETVKTLIAENEYNTNTIDQKTSLSPLAHALWQDQTEIAKILIDNGAHIEANEKNGRTPLFTAVHQKNILITKILLDKGANLHKEFKPFLDTPLHVSAQNKSEKISELLLQYGANPNARNAKNETPMHIAAKNGDLESVKVFLKYGADPEAQIIPKNMTIITNSETPHDLLKEISKTLSSSLIPGVQRTLETHNQISNLKTIRDNLNITTSEEFNGYRAQYDYQHIKNKKTKKPYKQDPRIKTSENKRSKQIETPISLAKEEQKEYKKKKNNQKFMKKAKARERLNNPETKKQKIEREYDEAFEKKEEFKLKKGKKLRFSAVITLLKKAITNRHLVEELIAKKSDNISDNIETISTLILNSITPMAYRIAALSYLIDTQKENSTIGELIPAYIKNIAFTPEIAKNTQIIVEYLKKHNYLELTDIRGITLKKAIGPEENHEEPTNPFLSFGKIIDTGMQTWQGVCNK